MTADEKREVQKISDALVQAHRFFLNRDTMNAAVHLAENVRYSPLTSEIEAAAEAASRLLES
jgi:hypothetical protein